MIINSVSIIFFSPTGTTKKIISSVAKGMGIREIKYIDLTLPDMRANNPVDIDDDILIIGVPVYEEMIPSFIYPHLTKLKGNNKPVILVGVYGNIGYGIVLDQLMRITRKSGFIPVAAGTFIGEHSFSTKELPIAAGRPNAQDLKMAEEFGQMIKNKMETTDNLENISLSLPKGNLPLMSRIMPKNSAKMFSKTPFINMDKCVHCGTCSILCPMSAIGYKTMNVNNDKCIRCFACVRNCPVNAIKIIYKKKILVKTVLSFKSRTKKEPKYYL